jgi:toxin FitB
MKRYLLDTNVISEVLRPSPDPKVAAWCQAADKNGLYLSVVSLGEIRKGLTIMPEGLRRRQLEAAFHEMIPNWFEGRIVSLTQAIAERWGVLEGERQLIGRPLHVPDAQIAAYALEHGLELVTRNVRDFEALGLTIVNPWEMGL